jgi:hypothetical protein
LNAFSNALVESTNTKIRLITRRSFGFHSPAPLIALAMLSLGGLCHPCRAVDSTHGYGRRVPLSEKVHAGLASDH